ncbi:MAG: SCO family protein [Chlorobiota bacterium]
MRQRHLIRIASIFIFAFLFISCNDNDELSVEDLKNSTQESESIEPSDISLFNLESNWENQDAETIQLSFLNGKPTIMTMIYTHCDYSCPVIVKEMKDLYSKIPQDYTSDVNFLFVSIDPIHDKPDTLKRFMKEEELNPEHWTMLSGTESNIRELAAVLGFKYKKSSLMDYAHSNLITLLNEKGEIVEQLEGFEENREKFISKAIELIEEK